MFYLSLLKRYIGISFRSNTEYPLAYMLGIVAQWLGYGFEFLMLWVMIFAFDTLGSWKAAEVLLLFAMNMTSYAIGASFTFSVMRELPDMARTGAFDDVLLKPVHSLIYMMCSRFNTGYVSHITLGTALLVVSFTMIGVPFTLFSALWLLVALLSASVIQGAMLVLLTIPSLFILGPTSLTSVVMQFKRFIDYPLSIFGRPIQILLTFVLPYGFISFFPAQPLINKADTLSFSPAILYMAPLAALALAAITILAWRAGVNRYESSGS